MTLRNIFNWIADTNIFIVAGAFIGLIVVVGVVLPAIYGIVMAVIDSWKNKE